VSSFRWGPESDEGIDAVRERLAARGLLRTEPEVRIRDVAPPVERPQAPPAPAKEIARLEMPVMPVRPATARPRPVAGVPRRRWGFVVVVVSALVVLLAVVALVMVAGAGASSPAEHSRLACDRFVSFKSSAANGTMTAAAIDAELDRIATMAAEATPAVRGAATKLASSGRPGQAVFLVASTEMSDACAARA
jgi:hypothetical protein